MLKNNLQVVFIFCLLLTSCQNNFAVETQPYAVISVRNNIYWADYQLDGKNRAIEASMHYSSTPTKEVWAKFYQKLENLTDKLENARLKLTIAEWETQVMPIYRHFERVLYVNSFSGLNFSDDFRQKIDDFPRAFAKIREKIANNPQTKEYWQRYIDLIFKLLVMELSKNVLNAILSTDCSDYQIVAYTDYAVLPKVGKPLKLMIWLAPTCYYQKNTPYKPAISLESELFRVENQSIYALEQSVINIQPQKKGKMKVKAIFKITNPITDETMQMSRFFYLPVHQ